MTLASLLGSWFLESQVARPLEVLREQALKVSTGASHSVTPLNRCDEIGMGLRAVGQLGLMFRWLIDDVAEQVLSVQHAVSEIAQGNLDLSARTEQAASNVQQTASSMSEMTETVNGTASSAHQASQLAASASDAAALGGNSVSKVVETMGEISTSSTRIADIISVIDGIAFQTNILALNAAVEAARAGEHGRGFAVVAAEVRALAQRSAVAAKEIKGLIDDSVTKVEHGHRIVEETRASIKGIVDQVQKVSGLIGEISAATNEQTKGISHIGSAVNDLDSITQQNAALVEQSAAASASLRQQTTRLAEAIAVFR